MTKLRVKDAGFTLIEVVIAMGVLSLGLLGLASLQATAMKVGNSALLRSQATSLAYSIVDAMLANRTAAHSGEYNQAMPSTSSLPRCSRNYILSGRIANQDLRAWRNALACFLPKGAGGIEQNNTTSFTITVEWDDSRGTEERQSFVIVTDIGQ